ncbi:MAG: hypothetical protein L0J53_04415, partial [Psychrobacter sp.]|nr:hypothetical protein [Psychrobacter sp.]
LLALALSVLLAVFLAILLISLLVLFLLVVVFLLALALMIDGYVSRACPTCPNMAHCPKYYHKLLNIRDCILCSADIGLFFCSPILLFTKKQTVYDINEYTNANSLRECMSVIPHNSGNAYIE